MTDAISSSRFLFSESFTYQMPENDQASYIFKEILNLLPVISLFTGGSALVQSIKKNRLYHENDDEESKRIYDVRFSAYSIALHTVNTIGLGILILPIRLIATSMRTNDILEGKEFDNPHFLNDWQLMSCESINNHKDTFYNGILNHRPNQGDEATWSDYAKRMAYRDHIKYPEHLFENKCAYKDPFRKSEDKSLEKIIKRNQKEYSEKSKTQITQYLKSIRRPKGNEQP